MEIWFKQKTRTRMNCEWTGKTISKKNPIQKNSKNQCEIAHLNKKRLARKQIFIQTPFLTLL